MENKYFTPSIEDIRLGYEAEALLPSTDSWVCDTWTPFTIDPMKYSHYTPWEGDGTHFDDVVNRLSLKQIRTPYLTKEQIEAEGWIQKGTPFWKGSYICYLEPLTHIIHIQDVSGDTLFKGECKCINTFRFINKLLYI